MPSIFVDAAVSHGHRFNPQLRKATGTTQENFGYHVYSPSSVINNQKQVEKDDKLKKHTNLIYTQNVQV